MGDRENAGVIGTKVVMLLLQERERERALFEKSLKARELSLFLAGEREREIFLLRALLSLKGFNTLSRSVSRC